MVRCDAHEVFGFLRGALPHSAWATSPRCLNYDAEVIGNALRGRMTGSLLTEFLRYSSEVGEGCVADVSRNAGHIYRWSIFSVAETADELVESGISACHEAGFPNPPETGDLPPVGHSLGVRGGDCRSVARR